MKSEIVYERPTQLLKVTDVATALRVSKAFVYKLIRNREIPSVQILGAKRIRQADLDNYINNNLVD